MAKHDKKKQDETAEVEIGGTDKPKLKGKEYTKEPFPSSIATGEKE
jgi:hypothetical protein